MQITADGKELNAISKALLRGDNDYVLLEEMRDAYAFKLALDITSTGTRRSKATIHSGDSLEIPFKMASAIVAEFGGDYKMRFYNDIIWVYEYQPDGLTASGAKRFINHPQGHGLWLREKSEFLNESLLKKFKMWYSFYCDHTLCE